MKRSNKYVSYVIEKIPPYFKEPIKVSDIMKGSEYEDHDPEVLITVLEMLKPWNAIEFSTDTIKSSTRVKVKSEIAGYFLNSLKQYFEQDLSYVSDWNTNATLDLFDTNKSLDYGVSVLHLFEQRRVVDFDDKIALKRDILATGIIKKNSSYLMIFDSKSNRYKFVGGKFKESDKTFDKTLARKMSESMYESKLVFGKSYTLKEIARDISIKSFSPSQAVYTEYLFNFFLIQLFDENFKLYPNYRWITKEELLSGITEDGINVGIKEMHIALDKALDGGIDSIESSFEVKRSKSQLQSEVSIEDIISKGESEGIEFKSSLRWDYQMDKENKGLEISVVKTIAGFLNSKGGTLIIGVNDKGQVLGLDHDYALIKHNDFDGFYQLVSSLIADYLGLNSTMDVEISRGVQDGLDLCVLSIKKSSKPVFVKQSENKVFYIRVGNTTRQIDSQDTYNYITSHW